MHAPPLVLLFVPAAGSAFIFPGGICKMLLHVHTSPVTCPEWARPEQDI